MRQTEVQPYVLITVMILAILMALGVFFTLMYLQRRPADNTYVVNVEGQEIVINPVPEEEVIIVAPEIQVDEVLVVEPQGGQPSVTNTPEPPPPPTETPIPATAVPVPVSDPDMYTTVTHVVSSNDTLYSLSQQYITSIALMARFGISSSDMIVGNTLTITVANSAYCPGYRPYVVIEGDTPMGLAFGAGITLEEFIQIGKLGPNNGVYETQVVCLP